MYACTAIFSFITTFTYAFSITITSLILWTSLVTIAYYKVETVNQKLNLQEYLPNGHYGIDSNNLLATIKAIYYIQLISDSTSTNLNKLSYTIPQVYARSFVSIIQCYCTDHYKLHFHLNFEMKTTFSNFSIAYFTAK